MSRNDKKSWNNMSALYDTFMKKDKKLYYEIVNKILKDVNTNDKILEIGTATGIISLLLADKLRKIEAIDFSEKMIEIARKKANKLNIDNVNFEIGNAYNLKYEDNSYDNVIIANVLHIMPEPEKAIKEIKRILKKDGKIFAPTFVHANSKKAKIFGKVASLIGFKAYSKWSIKTYEEFLVSQGLRVVQSQSISASFPVDYVVCEIEE